MIEDFLCSYNFLHHQVIQGLESNLIYLQRIAVQVFLSFLGICLEDDYLCQLRERIRTEVERKLLAGRSASFNLFDSLKELRRILTVDYSKLYQHPNKF